MLSRIAVLFKKELLVALREPKMRLTLIGPPLLQLLIFGYAVNLDVERSRLGWMDLDRTPESRALKASLGGSPYFDIVREVAGERDADDILDRGEAAAVVRVPPGFARDLRRLRGARIQLLVDGTNSNSAAIVSNYVNRALAEHGGDLARRAPREPGPGTGGGLRVDSVPLRVDSRVWFNPNLRSQDYFVPGVVVNIIALVTVMLTAMAVVREKEIGTLEQLMVTPIRRSELILGKTLPFAVVGLGEVMLVTGAALLVFGIPFLGSPFVLLAGAILFLLTTLGVGLMISTVSSTQQQAMMGSFMFFLPAFMLSGFAFPIRNMPMAVQYLTYLNPVRYFIEIVRGVFLKGVGMEVLWPQMLGLFLLGSAVLAVSVLRFTKRLD